MLLCGVANNNNVNVLKHMHIAISGHPKGASKPRGIGRNSSNVYSNPPAAKGLKGQISHQRSMSVSYSARVERWKGWQQFSRNALFALSLLLGHKHF